jgi:hypothetical protein
MTIDAISINQSNKTETSVTDKFSNWNGRSIIVADRAYQNKQNVEAGCGSGTYNAFCRSFITIGIMFAAAVAALSVGIATGSLPSALITGGVICAGALIVNLFLLVTHLT